MRQFCGQCGSKDLSPRGGCRACSREATRRYRLRNPYQPKRPRVSKYQALEFYCETCGKHVIIRGEDRGQHRGRFCSMRCAWTAHRHDGNPNWRGGIGNVNGYNWVRLSPLERQSHSCKVRQGGCIPTHRYKAELVLGRCLKADERVHHINGNKLDNRNSNLLICSNSYHGYLHQEMSRRWQQEKFGEGIVGAI